MPGGTLEGWSGSARAGLVRAAGDPNHPTVKGIDRVKGDRVEIVVDAGDTTRTYEVVASRAGRRVETAVRRGWSK
ncbi:hypothetical protein SHKM778_63540 [Streptomyces sp. KM77-8]|uniref:Uncharacterized protein n=1 Tax=Streptomyces haneummycinicus TaxID=3074435 RepID=A0AAT9HRF4_9ACTN